MITTFIKKIIRYWRSWKGTRISQKTADELSLYPELPHKKLSKIRSELFWICRTPGKMSLTIQETISDYFNMGIDREGEDLHQYLFKLEIRRARDKKRPAIAIVLSDKWLTAQFLNLCGIATTRPIVYVSPFITSDEVLSKLRLSGETHFFAKKVDGAMGKGAFPFHMEGNYFIVDGKKITDIELVIKLRDYIVEPYIDQHDELNRLYPNAITFLRMITVRKNNSIELMASNMFVGGGGSKAAYLYLGGLLLGISESGYLSEYGIRTKTDCRGRYTKHPDTGVVFKDFQIPQWHEAKDLVIRAHQFLPKIHSIGWDVTITKKGPVIIEGNSRYTTHLFQYTNGPGREYMKQWFDLK